MLAVDRQQVLWLIVAMVHAGRTAARPAACAANLRTRAGIGPVLQT